MGRNQVEFKGECILPNFHNSVQLIMVFQWRILELLHKIPQILNILGTSMKDLHFYYFLHIRFTSKSDDLTVKGIHFNSAAGCLERLYDVLRCASLESQSLHNSICWAHWISPLNYINYFWAGGPDSFKQAPLPIPFTACEGELEAVKLGHFHSLLHSMNSDG